MTELEQKVIELYNQGLFDVQIAKIVKKSADQIAYYRKKHNLINNRNKNYILNTDKIIEELKTNNSMYVIAKKYGCSSSYVRNLAIKNDIKRKSFDEIVESRRIVNNNPFEDLNNKEVQYWLGFLAADGSIYENRISLGLQEIDEAHIDKYIKFIGFDILKVKTIKHDKFIGYKTSFRNVQVKNFLFSLGLTPNKTFTLNYKGQFTNDFLRGVIDGDGYIRKNHTEISIATASLIFAKQLQKFIINNYNINCTIRKSKSCIYTVGVYGKKQTIKIIKELYENADIYLERKYLNAMQYRNILATTL